MADYPNTVYAPRAKENKSGVVYDPLKKQVVYVEDITKLEAEVVAIETDLEDKINQGVKTTHSPEFANLIITNGGVIKPSADATDAISIAKSNGTKWATFDLVNLRFGLGTDTPIRKVNLAFADSTALASLGDLSSAEGVRIVNTQASTNCVSAIHLVTSGVGSGSGIINQGVDANTSRLHFYTEGSNVRSIKMTIFGDGKTGFMTQNPTAVCDVNSDIMRLRTAKTPANSGASGNVGDICWDANYIYVCVATNTWCRSAIASW